MEKIGQALKVAQKTISKDLENYTHGINQTHAKTDTNPKGSGRPKGKKKTKRQEEK